MENLNDIEYNQKIKVLRMMYPNLMEIDTKFGRIYSTKSQNNIEVLDINASILLEFGGNNCDICGGYIIAKSNTDKLKILSLRTNKTAEIFFENYNTEFLESNGLLIIKSYAKYKILNSELETIWNNQGCMYIKYEKEDSFGYWYTYMGYDTRHLYKRLRINKLTEKVDVYDYIDLENNYSIIGTEVKDRYTQSSTIKLDRLSYVKYKLAYGGNIISEKSYCDILKTSDIQNSEYFYCYETYKGAFRVGVLDGRGKEVIQLEYKNIKYLGNGIFVCEKDNTKRIVDIKQNYTSEQINNNLCYIHDTLPIIVILDNNNWFVYDILGRKYKLVDIVSNFECRYCNQYPDFLKININLYSNNPVYKYITRNLEPVTDIKLIHHFNTLEWDII